MATCQNCGKLADCDFYFYPSQVEDMLLCANCATTLGFCISCGGFMAGNELDEHSGLPGICYECVQDLRAETGEFDEPDYDE